jgi:ComF family protein
VNCRRKTGLNRVWVLVSYDDVAKKLIYKLKYERAKSAARDIARVMDEQLPLLPENTIVTHLPTASSRIRVRGYDQAQLVARSLAKRKHLACKQLLGRKGGSRQVGASRKSRFQQLQGVFRLKHDVAGAHVLLVDDVLTTGASIESAAKALKSGGAKKVEAVVFAQP